MAAAHREFSLKTRDERAELIPQLRRRCGILSIHPRTMVETLRLEIAGARLVNPASLLRE
jgi:hypothetical protein